MAFLSAAATCLSLALLTQPGPPTPIEVTVGEPTSEPLTLEASGLTPEGEVIWAWVERHGRGAYSESLSGQEVLVADPEGLSTLERPSGVPQRALFVVLDVESGDIGLGVPEEYEPLIESLPPGAVVAADASQGKGPRFRLPHRRPEVLVLRPGKVKDSAAMDGNGGPPERGAWLHRAADGREDDADGEPNGEVLLELERFQPLLGEAGPPEKLRGSDVVLMLDLEELALVTTDLRGRVPDDEEPADEELSGEEPTDDASTGGAR